MPKAAIEVHKQLGPGLLESAYEACLAYELKLGNLSFERQKPISISYKGLHLECGFRLDFLVENLVVLELKAIDVFAPVHEAQMITYLKLTGCKLGLLLNFNVPLMTAGVKRIALDL